MSPEIRLNRRNHSSPTSTKQNETGRPVYRVAGRFKMTSIYT
jgi:hypothetical protein